MFRLAAFILAPIICLAAGMIFSYYCARFPTLIYALPIFALTIAVILKWLENGALQFWFRRKDARKL